MRTTTAIAPSWSVLRPVKGAPAPGAKAKGFPVYEALEAKLADAAPLDQPHAIARHVSAVLAGWAYSDADTVSMIMSRTGLKDCRVRCFEVANNGLLIRSTGFLVQSADGRVALLAYRGTDPFDLSTWAVGADINHPTILTSGNVRANQGGALVHAGFYRNQRATWYEIVGALKRALHGQSILEEKEEKALVERRLEEVRSLRGDEEPREAPPERQPLEALYVTGHSLGAAMATIAAYKIAADPDYPDIEAVLKQVYLFAPPMVGDARFKDLWNQAMVAPQTTLDSRVFAHTFERDVVPHVPPQGKTTYVHVGKHYASEDTGSAPPVHWVPAKAPRQCTVIDMLRAVEPLLFGHITWRELIPGGAILDVVKDVIGSRPLSFADHVPTNYVLCSQPPGVNSEFGDDF
jgi:hypothetical protein